MEPSQARTQLLAEHAQLRRTLDRLAEIAAAVREDSPNSSRSFELRETLQLLRDLFVAHNASEERLLGPILREDYAWGQARVDRMLEEHRAEHAEIRASMTGSDREVAERVADLKEMVEAHMAAEERTFLSPRVLRDDVVSLEGSG